jgi:hypothetical protein
MTAGPLCFELTTHTRAPPFLLRDVRTTAAPGTRPAFLSLTELHEAALSIDLAASTQDDNEQTEVTAW